MTDIRTAVIGVGNLGRHHARWYKNIDGSELIGVYDINQEKCKDVAGRLGVTAFEDISGVFGKVDAVSIVVPTISHHEVAEQLIKQKIDCLIEKPVATSIDEAERLRELADEYNVILTVGHIERFNPAVLALRNYDIAPRFIEAHRLAAFDPRGTDVAVILDLMIHDIELTLYFVKSRVKNIDASAVAVTSGKADIANARLTFENGAVANLTASRISLHQMRKLRIFQKSGYFSLDLAAKRADIYRLAKDSDTNDASMRFPLGQSGQEVIYNKVGGEGEDMLCAELTSFLQAVKNRTNPEVSLTEAAEALRIAIEIDKTGTNGAAP